ncbi:MAG: hypothetical protein IT371_13980 [Deltaproteobacteria bacterium]|nr:hypothetical protein [Deltaproteobacteria bacterium]
MQNAPIFIGGAALAGGILGYVIALSSSKKAAATAEARAEELEKTLEKVQKEAAEAASLKEARAKAEEGQKSAGEKAKGLEKELEKLRAEAKKAEEQLKESESAAAKAAEQASGYLAAKQQAEGRAQQAQGAADEAQQRAAQLEHELATVQQEQASLRQQLTGRGEELQRLRAELSSQRPAGGSSLEEAVELFSQSDGTPDGILRLLLEGEGQKTAVVADTNGMVVAAAGEPNLKEGVAAAAQLFSVLGGQLRGMVPFGQVKAFRLQDGHGVIAGRTFEYAGETMALATYGLRSPNDRALDGATANLSATL